MECDTCLHKGICKNEDNMKKFESDIREKQKLLEYQSFEAKIRCLNYAMTNNKAQLDNAIAKSIK